jgi:arsenate reductase
MIGEALERTGGNKNRAAELLGLNRTTLVEKLRNVATRVGGFEALIDREGKRYVDKGLKYAAPTGPRIEQALVDDPLLLRTPIVRSEGRATVGYQPDVWQGWLDATRS